MTFKNTKTILSASLIAAMILNVVNKNDKSNSYQANLKLNNSSSKFTPIHTALINIASFVSKSANENDVDLHQKLFHKIMNE